ncbi:hypothetical protein ACFQ9Z_38665 [Streptomyces sp. NPDC056580]|uniref:hypothetical protein n=1 Tax=Streptomyces sp. NPDC056580 TaxID=3345872 RepID=UPI0036907CF8
MLGAQAFWVDVISKLDGEGQAHPVQCRQQVRDAIGIDESAEHDGFEWSELKFRALVLDPAADVGA